MDIDIHLDGTWHSCASVQRTSTDSTLRGPVRLQYDADYALEHLDANDHRALTVRAPVDLGIRTLPQWPSFLIDLLPQGAARRRIERTAATAISAWELLERGAVNPVGNLRVRPLRPRGSESHPGFALQEMIERGDAFVDYAIERGAAVAGATDTQGDAPKFWVVEDEHGRWHPDSGEIPFAICRHALLKFPVSESGPRAADILRHEAAYQRIAARVGLRVTAPLPEFSDGALLIPRFDRRVIDGREIRLGVESLYSICGVIDSALTALRHDQVLIALARCVSDFCVELIEYVRRDLFNLALGNRDNHGRNTAVLKDVDGTMTLAPIYDFGPAYLDARAIARVIRWEGESPGGRGWSRVLDLLDVRFEEAGLASPREPLLQTFCETAEVFETLPQIMSECGVDEAIVAQRGDDIARLATGLRTAGG